MFRLIRLGPLFVLSLFLLSKPIFASDVEYDYAFDGESFLSWRSLILSVDELENPFESMPYEAMGEMRHYASLKEAEQKAKVRDDNVVQAEVHEQLVNLEARLREQGHDAEALYQQRNRIMAQRINQMNSPNPAVIDKEWRIAGFMAPIDFDGTKVTRFFMVPIAGACIHTPAPPPNQIILLEYEQGVELKGLEYGFWVEGTLETEVTTDVANYYDGESVVETIYRMQADEIHFFE
ncbi:DUF3299 domain-containing protein [Vibrio agarivorans]|uniref:DUF3299 domain-containing protein n=1 Tax=Vibrio agarivorans TaxID=153622 RepID=A0ABT7Y4A1_9VIBR|nr:DUF3299 domain-containing protein [Vibrio agarivorans]MDN2482873.1 DUF3299 domain-containing protein [Vibrio agarivorans]